MVFRRLLLYPFSVLYGCLGWVRNLAFDLGILPSESFDVPVISVGNLSMGGTGKTPHVEYLVRLLKDEFHVATLSRGYKRKTSGFILAGEKDTAATIGDEPLQYMRKFPGITVAVSEKRREGIKQLLRFDPPPQVILLDDAFQHRYVKAGLNILLTDYHKPFHKDYVVPTGRLREFRRGYCRADILVVTKTPKIFSPITRRTYEEEIRPKPWQHLYFSFLKYGGPVPLPTTSAAEECKGSYTSTLMVTGIANPDPMEMFLKESGFYSELETMIYPDHHVFTEKDVQLISKTFHNIVTRNKVLITTEKDAMRLSDPAFGHLLGDIPAFYLPVQVDFHKTDKDVFDRQILDYVRKNQRNRPLHPIPDRP